MKQFNAVYPISGEELIGYNARPLRSVEKDFATT
jgi:hypothetical protein